MLNILWDQKVNMVSKIKIVTMKKKFVLHENIHIQISLIHWFYYCGYVAMFLTGSEEDRTLFDFNIRV